MELPEKVKKFISGMVDGTTSVKVGHMMGSTDENFQSVLPMYSLYLIRNNEIVKEFIGSAEAGKIARLEAVTEFTADCVRTCIVENFANAMYPGD